MDVFRVHVLVRFNSIFQVAPPLSSKTLHNNPVPRGPQQTCPGLRSAHPAGEGVWRINARMTPIHRQHERRLT